MGCAATKKQKMKPSFDDQTYKLDSEDQTNLGVIAFKNLEKKHMEVNLEILSKTCSLNISAYQVKSQNHLK